MYVTHKGSKVERPVRELKGFRRIPLRAGETKTVTISLAAKSLAYWNDTAHRMEVEGDSIEVQVGGSSDSLPLKRTIAVGAGGTHLHS